LSFGGSTICKDIMDILIPATPEAGGSALTALLAADPGRRAVFDNLVSRLEADGRCGDRARYYIARHAFRRATLRSVVSATGQRIPEWTRESRAAERQNTAFIAGYRDTYNAFRKDVRTRPRPSAMPDMISGNPSPYRTPPTPEQEAQLAAMVEQVRKRREKAATKRAKEATTASKAKRLKASRPRPPQPHTAHVLAYSRHRLPAIIAERMAAPPSPDRDPMIGGLRRAHSPT
jgi:hypothetical protein